jgi:kynurenine formamidase
VGCRADVLNHKGYLKLFLEFSYTIGPELTVMDAGFNPPRIIIRSRIAQGKSSNTSYIELFAHTGTHIDMPWHFNEKGWKILDFEIGDFVFEEVSLIDIPKGAYEPVLWEELAPFESQLLETDALLIRTGFGEQRVKNPSLYVQGTPGLSVNAAKKLSGFDKLICIGVDFISIENIDQARKTGYPIHHTLLGRPKPLILLEDANLSVLGTSKINRIYLFPLRMDGLEASPVTAVAEI